MSNAGILGSILLWIVVCCGVGAWVGSWRGRPGAGIVLGLFGPLGWIVAALAPNAAPAEASPGSPSASVSSGSTPPISPIVVVGAIALPMAIIGGALWAQRHDEERRFGDDKLTRVGVGLLLQGHVESVVVVSETPELYTASIKCSNGPSITTRIPTSRRAALGVEGRVRGECDLAMWEQRARDLPKR